MTGEQIVIASGVVVAVGTVMLVLYAGLGKDLRRFWRFLLDQPLKVLKSLFANQQFWVAVLLLSVSWTLSIYARGNLSSSAETVLLLVAAAASGGVLGLTLVRLIGESTKALANPQQVTQGDEAKRQRIDNLRQQLYAAAASVHKYSNPSGAYTEAKQLEPVNNLIYRLLAEGEDLTQFRVPNDAMVQNAVDTKLLVQRLEALLIYLKPLLPQRDAYTT